MSAAGPSQGAKAPSGGSAAHEVASVGVGGMGGRHVVVMGVAGCGKSVVGEGIARELGLPLIEGDDFHPPRNIQKMQQGIALTDEDRADWLQTLRHRLASCTGGAVLTCSALKAAYRDILRTAVPEVYFVHLVISQAESLRRVAGRGAGHFYPPSLVASQFEALQDPAGERHVLVLDAARPLASLAPQAVQWLWSQRGLEKDSEI
ncbi:MAG TPA: gluconokinase [Burkholderiaceae bacterium]|nr:gluconokinase [Burkholderiaceae bacterium]